MTQLAMLFGALLPALPVTPTPACWVRPGSEAPAQRISTLDSASIALAGGVIKVCYGRPSARGRTMLGDHDPFGQPWRLGANEATSISLPVDVHLGDLAVPAGQYSLYVVADSSHWQVFVNRTVERWGVPINDAVRANDVGATTVPVRRTDDAVEQLTIRLASRGDGVELVITWEHWRAVVPISRD